MVTRVWLWKGKAVSVGRSGRVHRFFCSDVEKATRTVVIKGKNNQGGHRSPIVREDSKACVSWVVFARFGAL